MAISAIASVATSALLANGKRAAVAADNIANVSTEGFVPRELRTVSLGGAAGGGGVGSVIVDDPGAGLVEQFTTLIQARTAYAAAARTLVVADDLSRSTLDITS